MNSSIWFTIMDDRAQARLASLLEKLKQAGGFRSLRAFSMAHGLKPNTVQKWADGESLPTGIYLRKLAEIAGMSLDQMFLYLDGKAIDVDEEGKSISPKAETIAAIASQMDRKELAKAIGLLATILSDESNDKTLKS